MTNKRKCLGGGYFKKYRSRCYFNTCSSLSQWNKKWMLNIFLITSETTQKHTDQSGLFRGKVDTLLTQPMVIVSMRSFIFVSFVRTTDDLNLRSSVVRYVLVTCSGYWQNVAGSRVRQNTAILLFIKRT